MEELEDHSNFWDVGKLGSEDGLPLVRSDSVGSIQSISSAGSTSSSRAKTWVCEYEGCSKAFTRPSQLTEHQETVHQGLKPFTCTECGRQFTRKTHLERHMFTHTAEKPFHCSHCGKGVTTRQQLRRHEITHTRSFVCPHEGCGESFYKHPQLRSHVLAVHLQKLNCEFCGKKFQRPYRLKNHIAKHHNPDTVYKYQCSHGSCVEAFKTWTALQQHVKEAHPKLQCPTCGKACVGEQGLQMHMRVHSSMTVIKNWKCESCPDLYFAKKADLVSHCLEHHKDLVSTLLNDNGREPAEPSATASSNNIPLESGARPSRLRSSSTKHDPESELESIQTEVKLRKYFDSGKSSVSLLLNSAGRKLKCPYLGCYRSFKTEEKYEMHIQKHKIHQLKLKILQEKDQATSVASEENELESNMERKNGNSQDLESLSAAANR
ncbi:Transcription factor IIIA [Lachancea thermotolerans]